METKNLNNLVKPALKFAGTIGTLGGFIADVLSPLGPILLYLVYISFLIFILSLPLIIFSKTKKELFKSITLTSLMFSVIFGVFGQFNKETDNGFLGDNIQFISELQSSLSLIDEKLDAINDKIDTVDNKLDDGFNNLEKGVNELNDISTKNNETLTKISYQQEEVLTSIEGLNNIGSDLREMLGLKTITFPSKLMLKIDNQLKSEEYNKLYNYFSRRAQDYDYYINTTQEEHQINNKLAIEKIPNTDIGYYVRTFDAIENGDYDSAVKLADSALAINPKSYLSFRARAMIDSNNSKLDDLNKAFELKPNSWLINTNRGLEFLNQENYNNAVIDFKKAFELTNYNNYQCANFIASSLWDSKRWKELGEFLESIDSNEYINYLKEAYGEQSYVNTFSRFFLVNNNNVADISFIKSDIVSEVDNIYIGYFQYNNNGIISYSTSSVDGKYNSINKRDVFGVNFYSPEQPIIDLNRIKLHDVTFYLMREGYEENISKIRNSQNKEIFTVIFKVMDDTSFSGEILYINKGIDDRGNFKEFPVYKNLNITSNGKITNWNE
jgi:TolA-binding protein|tara:strand:+ start:606 stop:2267 length:1662 start_codon:yes stop_codon:yes gene_type:complete